MTAPPSLRALALALVLATAVPGCPALASGTPSVATRTYEVCGPWKNNLLHPYGTYRIANYNDFVPAPIVIGPTREIPYSRWQFYYDGVARGFAYNDAFVAVLLVVDEIGVTQQEIIYGEYQQKKRRIRLEVDTTRPAAASIPSSGVIVSTNRLTTTAANGFVGMSGPFRFRAGLVVGNALPAPLTTTTNYFIRYVSTTTFEVSLVAGGPAVDLTTVGTGVHTIYPFGEPLGNTYKLLSQLFLLGDSDTIGVLDPVSVTQVKLKAKVNKNATKFEVRLTGRTTYDIVTDDLVDGQGVRGKLRYRASTSNCTLVVP